MFGIYSLRLTIAEASVFLTCTYFETAVLVTSAWLRLRTTAWGTSSVMGDIGLAAT